MSWEQLLSIYRQASDEKRAEDTSPPEACPQCGEPLGAAVEGRLHCPFDGWTWP